MSLSIGTRIGPYEILSTLGAGGMGEVYRARDMKLNRDVAIKVLLPAVANDPDRLARFSREAQVLASLNHPNIAHIHGLEESNGVTALVMELVEGEDLSVRIRRGAIPIDEALPIARQIAEALEAAHDHGIIHRDLKPANVKVRPDGTVKVLDFGLAKAVGQGSGIGDQGSAGAANSPTLSIHATEAGIILGTAAYMSPEQARGKAVDKRTDIWAFGAVLFEMLTGRRAFPGDDATDTIIAVVSKEPDWNALPPSVSSGIHRLLRRCLEKESKRRFDSAGVVRIEIDDALTSSYAEAPRPISASRRWLRVLPWVFAVAALALAAVFAWRGLERESTGPIYASLEAPTGFVLGEDDSLTSLPMRTPIVFTADGGALIMQAAQAGRPRLFIRQLDRPDARPIAGTDNARAPFVSPDGKWIGFWANGEIRKVAVEGGVATTVSRIGGQLGPNGATWSTGDVIVFGDDESRRIMRVSANGGTPTPVTTAAPGTRRQVAPFFLPDGKRFLFSDISSQDANDARVMVQSLDGGDATLVVPAATDGRLLPTGQLAFMRLGTLMTVSFDLAGARTTGEPLAVMGDVMQSGVRGRTGGNATGAGMFAVSRTGTLAAIRGALIGANPTLLTWMTRDGRSSSAEPASGARAGGRLHARIAPDQSRAIVAVAAATRRELWIADWARNLWTPFGNESRDPGPAVWSPDGQRLLVGRGDALVVHALDGSRPEQILAREADRLVMPIAWLADGRIAYQSSSTSSTAAGIEIKLLERDASAGRVVVPLGVTLEADLSRDGRWIAYRSAQSGQLNVIVQAFPGPGARLQVSANGGQNPAWSADGKTLYYLQPGAVSSLFAADIKVTPVLASGTPRELFRLSQAQGCSPRCFDVTDDQRFLFRFGTATTRESVTRMDLITNWAATLGVDR